MSDIVTSALREILVHEGQVALPGLGTLLRHNRPAQLISSDGKISPPSARIEFNNSLVIDDGRLLKAITNQAVPVNVAKAEIDEFTKEARQALAGGNDVTLPNLGVLKRQQDGTINFTSRAEVISRMHSGLPAVAFTPIPRAERAETLESAAASQREVVTESNTTGRRTISRPPRAGSESTKIGREVQYAVAVLLILLVCWAAYSLFQSIGDTIVDDPRTPVATDVSRRSDAPSAGDNVAASPTGTTVDANTISPDDPPRLSDDEVNSVDDSSVGANENTNRTNSPELMANTPVASIGENVAVIAVGMYVDAAYAEEKIIEVRQAGYLPWVRNDDNGTRLGIELSYDQRVDRTRALADIRDLFGEQCFVMTVNGRFGDFGN